MRAERSRIGLRVVALGYLALLLVAPIGMVFYRTFEHGFGAAWDAVTAPDAVHAFWLTLLMVAIAVPANTIFGVAMALLLVRGRFRGKAFLNAVIDLPFAVSPVVIGLALILVYGRTGWFGDWLSSQRDPGHLRLARDGARDDLRVAAVRGPRGRAGAARGRHRPGARPPARWARVPRRRSGASRCRRSAGASPTA